MVRKERIAENEMLRKALLSQLGANTVLLDLGAG
jgi:hypothetical protein